MPHTVPNKPMNGAADAMLDSVGMSAMVRCCSLAMARLAIAISRSELRLR